MYYVDTHCHLDLFPGIQEGVENEDSVPVKTITVTNAPFIYQPNQKLFNSAKNIRVALGMHPELVAQYPNQLELFSELETTCRYIGEIGLDGSMQHKASFELQRQIFGKLLSQIAKSNSKILTIHSRNAAREVIECLHKSIHRSHTKVILHWYSGSIEDLSTAINYGYYFSVNHKMLSTQKCQAYLSLIPPAMILTETDAPFTFDKKVTTRLQSLELSVSLLASIWKKEMEETKALIFENFKTLIS